MDHPTDEILERLCEAFWNGSGEGISFTKHSHDVINATYDGTIDVDGVEYGFIIEDGNWNGTVVLAWGDPEDVGSYVPPRPTERMTLIPKKMGLTTDEIMQYRKISATSEFSDAITAYYHDKFFAPGVSLDDFIQKRADEITTIYNFKPGLRLGYLSEIR